MSEMLLTPLNALSPFAKASSGLWPAYATHKALLHGCVGLWAPVAGPQGTMLYDFSGYWNHGALTNIDPASDWVPSYAGYTLDFNTSNAAVMCPNPPGLSGSTYSTIQWVYARAINSTTYNAIGFGTDSVGTGSVHRQHYVSGSLFRWGNNGRVYTCPGAVENKWQSIGFAINAAGSPIAVIDGVQQTVTGSGAMNVVSSGTLQIGKGLGGVPGTFDGLISLTTVFVRMLNTCELVAWHRIGPSGIFDLDEISILAALKSGQLTYPAVYRHCLRRL